MIVTIPLIMYVFIDAVWGLKAGVITAILSMLGIMLFHYLSFNEIDEFLLGEGVLIIAFGLLSLWFNNSRYFKLQPVVVAMAYILVLLWFELFSEPLLVKMIPGMIKIAPDYAQSFTDPHSIAILRRLSIGLIFVFVIHAAVVAWSALRLNNFAWLLSRLSFYPMVLFAAIVVSQW
ncbi:MAG: septation protein IspZ [Oligoflexus sp.]